MAFGIARLGLVFRSLAVDVTAFVLPKGSEG